MKRKGLGRFGHVQRRCIHKDRKLKLEERKRR